MESRAGNDSRLVPAPGDCYQRGIARLPVPQAERHPLTGFRAMNRATVDRIVGYTPPPLHLGHDLEKPVHIGQVQVAAPVRNASGYSLTALPAAAEDCTLVRPFLPTPDPDV